MSFPTDSGVGAKGAMTLEELKKSNQECIERATQVLNGADLGDIGLYWMMGAVLNTLEYLAEHLVGVGIADVKNPRKDESAAEAVVLNLGGLFLAQEDRISRIEFFLQKLDSKAWSDTHEPV